MMEENCCEANADVRSHGNATPEQDAGSVPPRLKSHLGTSYLVC